jgi:hypothetical protein
MVRRTDQIQRWVHRIGLGKTRKAVSVTWEALYKTYDTTGGKGITAQGSQARLAQARQDRPGFGELDLTDI